jgi:phosphatidate cytidylyltransferase
MLKQRVITALALLALLLPALFAEQALLLAAIGLLLVLTAGWEWGRLNQLNQSGSVFFGLLNLGLCALLWWFDWPFQNLGYLWWCVGAGWFFAAVLLLRTGTKGWRMLPKAVRLLLGLLALAATWLALVSAKFVGTNFLLSVLLLVWVADIAAYFAGRAFGKHKLAVSISPGKTWEGVTGAVTGVLLLAVLWLFFDDHVGLQSLSIYSLLQHQYGWGMLLPLLLMVGMSVSGDLIESLIKRYAGVKDSSGLLPGHGGVLDRIDALMPTLPLALMLTSGGGL